MNKEKIYPIYSLRDRLADNFRTLNIGSSDEEEKRNVSFSLETDKHMLFMAKDLELCHVANIDIKSGEIVPIVPIKVVCRLDSLIKKEIEE